MLPRCSVSWPGPPDLDFRVFSGQEWADLHLSHSKDIIVHWPDGHSTRRIEKHIEDLEAMFVFAPDTRIEEHPIRIGQDEWTAVTGIMEGTFSRPIVELREEHGARPARRGRLGLFHFAILLPDRSSLGRFVSHLGELDVEVGAGDHLVSEAIYLADPDGLGIEVYADRPRETWRRSGRELLMATDPLDVAAVLAAGGGSAWTGMPEGTRMGHVHLQVGDLALASRFYSAALGLDRVVWSYPGALFLSAGGYHHHLGTNVWAGPGARPPAPDEARLLEWTLELPDGASVGSAAASLLGAGFAAELAPQGTTVRTRDPWGTALARVARKEQRS